MLKANSWRSTSHGLIALCAVLLAVGIAPEAQRSGDDKSPAVPGSAVSIARATQYDITSASNGERYRVFVSMPYGAKPNESFPVVYLLEGNIYFSIATGILERQSLRTMGAAIVVGIGYPTDDPETIEARRGFDLTPFDSPDVRARSPRGGGGLMFLRMIEEQVKPLVQSNYPVDRSRQILYGHSVGGALALRAMFTNPTAFSSYVLSSPSIFIDNRDVLKLESSFSERAKSGELHLRILITSAADEQYRGPDPALLAAAQVNRMVDNASELAERLATLDPANVIVQRTIFAGEVHGSVPPASLNRGLRFALPNK